MPTRIYRRNPRVTERTGYPESVRGPDTYSPLFYVRIQEAGHGGSMRVPAHVLVEGFYPNWARVMARDVIDGKGSDYRLSLVYNNGTWYINRILPDPDIEYRGGQIVPPEEYVNVGEQHEIATDTYVESWSTDNVLRSSEFLNKRLVQLAHSNADDATGAIVQLDDSGVTIGDGETELVSDRDNDALNVRAVKSIPGDSYPVIALGGEMPPDMPIHVINPRGLTSRVSVRDNQNRFVGSFPLSAIFADDGNGATSVGTFNFNSLFGDTRFRVGSRLQLDASALSGAPAPDAPGALTVPRELELNVYQTGTSAAVIGFARYVNEFKRLDWVDSAAPMNRPNPMYEAIEFGKSWTGNELAAAFVGGLFIGTFTASDNLELWSNAIPRNITTTLPMSMNYAQSVEVPGRHNYTRTRDVFLTPGLGFRGRNLPTITSIANRLGLSRRTMLDTMLNASAGRAFCFMAAGTQSSSSNAQTGYVLGPVGATARATVGRQALRSTDLVRGFLTNNATAQLTAMGVTVSGSVGNVSISFGSASLRGAGWRQVQDSYSARGSRAVTGVAEIPQGISARHIERISARGFSVRPIFSNGQGGWITPYVTVQVQLKDGYYLRRS